MATKNITLAIDEDLLDKVRVLAAMKRTTVNEMVRKFLKKSVDEEAHHDEATRALLRLAQNNQADFGPGPFVRDETYSGEKRFDRWR